MLEQAKIDCLKAATDLFLALTKLVVYGLESVKESDGLDKAAQELREPARVKKAK
jgi:hypothetical protein